jgi:hypothetical protein
MRDEEKNGDQKARAAYVSYRSFESFLDYLHKHGFVPSKLDSTAWPKNFSGGTISHLRVALRFLGLVGESEIPTQKLRDLVERWPDNSQPVLREIFDESYGEFIRDLNLSEATLGQLNEALGARGDVGKKIVSFFIALSRSAGVPLNPLLEKAGRARRGRPLKSETPRQRPRRRERSFEDTDDVTPGDTDWLLQIPPPNPEWPEPALQEYLELVKAWKKLRNAIAHDM